MNNIIIMFVVVSASVTVAFMFLVVLSFTVALFIILKKKQCNYSTVEYNLSDIIMTLYNILLMCINIIYIIGSGCEVQTAEQPQNEVHIAIIH